MELLWLSIVLVANISFATVFVDFLPSVVIFGKFNLSKIIVYLTLSSVVFTLILDKLRKIKAKKEHEKIKIDLLKKVEEDFAKSPIIINK